MSFKKISLIDNLLSRGIIDSNVLASAYEQYFIDNEIVSEFDYATTESDLEKRVFLYNQIR